MSSIMIIKYLDQGGNICEVHGINSKTCKRSKKCKVTSVVTPIAPLMKNIVSKDVTTYAN